MTINDIAKALRRGVKVEGWSLSGDIMTNGERWYVVHASLRRTHVTEIPNPDEIPFATKKTAPLYYKKICKDCGAEIVVSKYHMGKERCTLCEQKYRQSTGEDQAKVCLRCGETFYKSKFRPYDDPQYCLKCSAVLRARSYRNRRYSRGEKC